jgi:hypothetical protein
MVGGEAPASRRGSGLEEHRLALRRPSRTDRPAHIEVPAVVIGYPNLVDIIENSDRTVLDDGVVGPAVPQLHDHVEGFLGDPVALVMVDDAVGAEVVGCRSGEAGDQIPARPAAAEVIQRQQLPCQLKRRNQGR